MKCQWTDVPQSTDERGWRRVRCRRCSFQSALTPHDHDRILRQCPIPGWGDYLAFWLTMIGIDKQRVFGWILIVKPKATGCGCDQRQEALNVAGEHVASVWRRIADYFNRMVRS